MCGSPLQFCLLKPEGTVTQIDGPSLCLPRLLFLRLRRTLCCTHHIFVPLCFSLDDSSSVINFNVLIHRVVCSLWVTDEQSLFGLRTFYFQHKEVKGTKAIPVKDNGPNDPEIMLVDLIHTIITYMLAIILTVFQDYDYPHCIITIVISGI